MHKLVNTSLAMLLLCLPLATQADNHALRVLKSDPPAGQRVTASPKSIRIWFDGSPGEVGDDALALTNEQGDTVPVFAVHTMGEKDLMGFVQGELTDGAYTMHWRAGGQSGTVPFVLAQGDSAESEEISSSTAN